MTRHATSIKRLAKLAVLVPLELALRAFTKAIDHATRDRTPNDTWTHEPARDDW